MTKLTLRDVRDWLWSLSKKLPENSDLIMLDLRDCAEAIDAHLSKPSGGAVSEELSNDREALLYLMRQFDAETWDCPQCGHEESTSIMDSAYFLREYLANNPVGKVVISEEDVERAYKAAWLVAGEGKPWLSMESVRAALESLQGARVVSEKSGVVSDEMVETACENYYGRGLYCKWSTFDEFAKNLQRQSMRAALSAVISGSMVPDAQEFQDDVNWMQPEYRRAYVDGWNACRNEMIGLPLAASPPAESEA